MRSHSQDQRLPQDELRQTAPVYDAGSTLRSPPTTPTGRMAIAGPTALSDDELLEVLLAPSLSATKPPRDFHAALQRFGGVSGLPWATVSELNAAFGHAVASRLQASLELATRIARAQFQDRPILNQPERVVDYLRLRYAQSDQEVMGVLYLNCRHIVIHERELFRGTLTQLAVEPRAILKEGLLRSAASFLIYHTHPSGNADPSLEDLKFTRKLKELSELLGMPLDDHLILGSEDRWISLKKRGAWS